MLRNLSKISIFFSLKYRFFSFLDHLEQPKKFLDHLEQNKIFSPYKKIIPGKKLGNFSKILRKKFCLKYQFLSFLDHLEQPKNFLDHLEQNKIFPPYKKLYREKNLEIFRKFWEKKNCLKYRFLSFLDHLEQPKKFLDHLEQNKFFPL